MSGSYVWQEDYSKEFEEGLAAEREQEIERIDAMLSECRQPMLIEPKQSREGSPTLIARRPSFITAYVLERSRLVAAVDKAISAKREKFYLEQRAAAILQSYR